MGDEFAIMADHHDRGALLVESVDQVHDRLHTAPVLSGGGLVDHQDLGLGDQRRGHRDQLSLSAGQRQRVGFAQIRQTGELQHGGGPRGDLCLWPPCHPQREADLIGNRATEDLMIGILEDVTDLTRQLPSRPAGDIASADQDPSGGWTKQSVQVFGDSRLSRPVGPGQSDELPGADREVDAVQHLRPR